eukprot:jgi/Botrbrau1/22492/Bobra.114_2s0018.1
MILATIVISIFLKHTLAAFDNYLEGRWENKGVYVFYLELITDMIHLLIYMVFFVIVFTQHGLPLHLVRDLYWTFRNFRNRVADFLRYRRVTANMDERFPDATPEDMQRCDAVCIICREDMSGSQARAKRLACSHVFHLHCLRSWLERQQNCPICRTSVFAQRPEEASPEEPPAEPELANPDMAGGDPAGVVHAPAEFAVGQAGLRHRWAPVQAHVPAAAAGAAVPPPYTHLPPAMEGSEALRRGGDATQQAPGLGLGPPPMGMPPGIWPPPNVGIMWNMPQWAPSTSMALYLPAHHLPLQYAGQQGPDFGTVPGSQGLAVPLLPMVLPQALLNPMGPLQQTPFGTQQQQEHHAAATATAAAAHAFGNMMMVPPSILTHGVPSAVAPSSEAAMTYTAMNAAAAAAYAAVSRAPPQPDALEQLLRQQREVINQHLAVIERDRARSSGTHTDSASIVSGTDSNAPEASASGCNSAPTADGLSCESSASLTGAGLSQKSPPTGPGDVASDLEPQPRPPGDESMPPSDEGSCKS